LKYLSKGKQKVGNSSYDSPVREPKNVSVSDTIPIDYPDSKEQRPKVSKQKKSHVGYKGYQKQKQVWRIKTETPNDNVECFDFVEEYYIDVDGLTKSRVT
jgi:hypothetical protein